MFFRQKRSGEHVYLQIVENRWEKGRSKQRVVATVGRLDQLQQSGQLDGLLQSGAKFAEAVMVLSAHRQRRGARHPPPPHRAGAGLRAAVGELQIPQVIQRLLAGRRFAIAPGTHPLPDGVASVVHLRQRSLVRVGLETGLRHSRDRSRGSASGLSGHGVAGRTAARRRSRRGPRPLPPRCTKDAFEEALFDRRRDLFSHLDLVFFDTTSIYFEGEGGVELGQYGHSKDHRPDCKQMVVGVVLDGEGRPLCCELWPGNVTDVKTLIPVVDRLQQRFRIRSICIVADRGMISQETIAQLQADDARCISSWERGCGT